MPMIITNVELTMTPCQTMRDGWWNTRLLTGTTPTGYPEVK